MSAEIPENIPPLNEEPIEKIILRSMSEGVITLECTGRIFTVNPAALRILGLLEEQVIGRPFQEAFAGEVFNDEFKSFFMSTVNHERLISGKDLQYKRPDGQIVDLSITASFLEVDACIQGMQNVVVVFRDVSALKALEKMKRRAVNHLSHELRTPLSVISASIGRISDDLPGHKLTKNLQRIRRNLKRLMDIQGIVEEMLNPPEFKPARIYLPSKIGEVLAQLSARFSHRKVTVKSQICPEETDILDPAIVNVVLESLVKNAVEATPDGGEIFVSVAAVPEGVLFKVQDEGIGIRLQDQAFIFDGLHHTQATEEYSSRRPYDFDAGGKGLELLRLKTMAEAGYFDIYFESRRCKHVAESGRHCCGEISSCPYVDGPEACSESGGSVFSVLFRSPAN
jgi:PAS domain S-box-containing protein